MSDARTVTIVSGGPWYGTYGTSACPVCQPEARPDQSALTLRDGAVGLLVHCKKAGCTFRQIIPALDLASREVSAPKLGPVIYQRAERQAEISRRAVQAQAIWENAGSVNGTIAEMCLRRRGITCDLPNTLRLHGEAWHGPTKRCYPALVARLDGLESFAVHRTYLRADGSSKAPIDPPKAMLGATTGGLYA